MVYSVISNRSKLFRYLYFPLLPPLIDLGIYTIRYSVTFYVFLFHAFMNLIY